MIDFGRVSADPDLRRCARHWAARLAYAGVTGYSDEDLVQEAICRLLARVRADDREAVLNPVAFCCTTVRNDALMKLRAHGRHPTVPTDPNEAVIANVPRSEGDYVQARERWLAEQTTRYLTAEREVIWARATACLGASPRPDGIWAAASQAAYQLILGVTGLNARETLTTCLIRADVWWRDDEFDAADSDVVRRAAERRTKRINRDLPWVSYVGIWEGLRWAYHGEVSGLTRELARTHYGFVSPLLNQRTDPVARAALEAHLADVRQALQPFGQDWSPIVSRPHTMG